MNQVWDIDNPLDCPLVYAVGIIGGKWKPALLHMLSGGALRYGQLRRNIPPVSQKMLTQQLRELEADGIVVRTVYPAIPPQVDYRLSDKGQRLDDKQHHSNSLARDPVADRG